ncbi:MAG: formate dehydrogenase accessory sulfurtransferase FdhD [Candidatus Stahlbacteria bacterium]|nr:formate dehydrogenase accessory sulfurtransferase FdhD [Candidatus Stahlbacteria bacterium]
MNTKEVTISKFKQDKIEIVQDRVIIEQPLNIVLNNIKIISLLCIPDNIEALSIGFLVSEGVIEGRNEIKSISVRGNTCEVQTKEQKDLEKWGAKNRVITSGCGKGVMFNNLELLGFKAIDSKISISGAEILNIVHKFQLKSELYKTTGGVHSAALSDGTEILLFHEDIGRHNAVDKVIGDAFLRQILLKDKLLITSGRISSEIILKIAKASIPILVSISAPTDMAIGIAEKIGITLIGFARGERMNIYAHEKRIQKFS